MTAVLACLMSVPVFLRVLTTNPQGGSKDKYDDTSDFDAEYLIMATNQSVSISSYVSLISSYVQCLFPGGGGGDS